MKAVKKFLSAIVAAGALLSAATSHATMIINTWDPADVTVTNTASYSYTHNLTASLHTLLAGGGMYVFDDALLNVYLKDPQGGNEKIQFTLGSGTATQVFAGTGTNQVPNGVNDSQFPVILQGALPDLQDDGILHILLKVTPGTGNFVFDKSVLIADVHVVPEPGSIALFGLCLLAAAAYRRKSIR